MNSMKWLALPAVAALGLVAIHCGSKCGPSNCTGCCDSIGNCWAGTTPATCGTGGATCQVCTSSQTCSNSVCTLTSQNDGGTHPDAGQSADAGSCDSTSCSQGCCQGSICVTYVRQSGNACGTSGQACQTCNLTTQTCESGVCVSGCGSSSCSGCCAAGGCVDLNSQSASQCGHGGALCRGCASGDVCSTQGICLLPVDAGSGVVDAGPVDDFPCGPTPPCSVTQSCCVNFGGTGMAFECEDTCPNPADEISCGGPQDCTGGQFCCGTETVNGGTSPNCTATSLGDTCQASCPTQFACGCQGTNQVVLCNTSADCTADPNYNMCCTFTQNGASITFCASLTLSFGASGCN
jgi:hypothetical protein